MNLIVAADKNWAIGKNGKLLVNIPADQQLFREETTGKVVIMGRKTLEDLPGGQPLAKRTNLVLSRDQGYKKKGALVLHSLEAVLKECEKYPSEDIFVAGGAEIYRLFLPYCNAAHVTYIDYAYQGDVFFPDLDQSDEWVLAAASDEETYFDLCYEFRLYVRRPGKA